MRFISTYNSYSTQLNTFTNSAPRAAATNLLLPSGIQETEEQRLAGIMPDRVEVELGAVKNADVDLPLARVAVV